MAALPDADGLISRLRELHDDLRQRFVERSDVIEGSLAALLAGLQVLLIGPPGTAKSMLADEICRRIDGGRYFQWLLTKFTTPEELFGAVSLRSLENDDYRRVTSGKLPEAEIAFLDEVFKASSSILNALLTILNERRFDNGRERMDVPLLTLFGAANELPDDEELQAIYDRFLVRFVVDYIEEDYRFLRMLRAESAPATVTLSPDDLKQLSDRVADIEIPDSVLRTIVDLRRELADKQVVASDRRYRQSLRLLQALALLRGRTSVSDEDLAFLEHVLWHDPSEREAVRDALRRLIRGFEEEVQELLFQGRELGDYVGRAWESETQRARASIEVETKLRRILSRLDELERQASESGREIPRASEVRRELESIRQGLI